MDDAGRIVDAILDGSWDIVPEVSSDIAAVPYLLALSDPRLLELPPRMALEAHLRLLVLSGAVEGAAFWLGGVSTERLTRVATAGAGGSERTEERAAELALDSPSLVRAGSCVAVPVLCWDVPHGALVACEPAHANPDGLRLLRAAARAVAAVVERDLLLERNAGRERTLLEAGERRLLRAGLDIHDGPVQALAAASIEVHLLREQFHNFARDERSASLARGRLDDIEAKLARVQDELRDVARTLESGTTSVTPLVETARREVAALSGRLGIDVELRIVGTFDHLTDSQRIAILRILQESLANVAEHSGAARATVLISNRLGLTTAEIADDGKGFDVGRALVRAARAGRLGLVGMSERARLLGGTLEVRSQIGGPTTVRLVLPEWRSLRGAEPAAGASDLAKALGARVDREVSRRQFS